LAFFVKSGPGNPDQWLEKGEFGRVCLHKPLLGVLFGFVCCYFAKTRRSSQAASVNAALRCRRCSFQLLI